MRRCGWNEAARSGSGGLYRLFPTSSPRTVNRRQSHKPSCASACPGGPGAAVHRRSLFPSRPLLAGEPFRRHGDPAVASSRLAARYDDGRSPPGIGSPPPLRCSGRLHRGHFDRPSRKADRLGGGRPFGEGGGQTILGGSVRVEKPENGSPQVLFRPAGWEEDLPLARASSMVTEMIPVAVYLRHHVQAGETIIIEEPEAHMHPEMQVRPGRGAGEDRRGRNPGHHYRSQRLDSLRACEHLPDGGTPRRGSQRHFGW